MDTIDTSRPAIEALLDENERLKAELAQATARAERAEEWRDAVIDAAVVDWTYNSKHTPREAINALLTWQAQITLDPEVSKEAHDLVARAESAEALVTALKLELDSAREQFDRHVVWAAEQLQAERNLSLSDPAEQRAERYAMEALELSGKLIAAEARATSAEEERDALRAGLATYGEHKRGCSSVRSSHD